jgi:hypothetical protein
LKSVRTPDAPEDTAAKSLTQHRSIRISDEDWRDAEAAAAGMGTDRAKIVNQFIRWYLHRPGARIPKRPDRPAC